MTIRLDAFILPDGTRAAVLGLDITEAAPPLVREGLARRALVNGGGTCPCGALAVMPNRAERRAAVRTGRLLRVQVQHEHDCPAIAPAVLAWVARN